MIVEIKNGDNCINVYSNSVKMEMYYCEVEPTYEEDSYKIIAFKNKDLNAYLGENGDFYYEDFLRNYIVKSLVKKLELSANDLIVNGYRYNPNARILIDHINLLEKIKEIGTTNKDEFYKFKLKLFSESLASSEHYFYLGPKSVIKHLEKLSLINTIDDNFSISKKGEKLLKSKQIKLPAVEVEEDILHLCTNCGINETKHKMCVECRIKTTDKCAIK